MLSVIAPMRRCREDVHGAAPSKRIDLRQQRSDGVTSMSMCRLRAADAVVPQLLKVMVWPLTMMVSLAAKPVSDVESLAARPEHAWRR